MSEDTVAQGGIFSLALAGGDTPQTLYHLLAQPPFVEQLPWSQMHFFWGDERCVPPDDPESNYEQARRTILKKELVPEENIHRIRGEWGSIKAAQDYAVQLRTFAAEDLAWPRFDLVLLGMGADGHTASLFPGQISADELVSPTLAVTANYQGRPAPRVTLTPLVFNSAHHLMFLVTGKSKAEALAAVLGSTNNPKRWPVQRIHPSKGSVVWMVDEDAASQLPGNINYLFEHEL